MCFVKKKLYLGTRANSMVSTTTPNNGHQLATPTATAHQSDIVVATALASQRPTSPPAKMRDKEPPEHHHRFAIGRNVSVKHLVRNAVEGL